MAHYASQRSPKGGGEEESAFRLLITAGPTHEPIDAVRYLANRSSGRLGVALAEEAVRRGLHTTLLLGPTHLEPQAHSHLKLARFRTTTDLQRLLCEHWPDHNTLVMAAAVADYRPKPLAGSREPLTKIQRTGRPLTLELEPTPDLLAELSTQSRPDQRLIGFALEPAERLLESARTKLARKNLDAIVANPLESMDAEALPGGAMIIFKEGDTLSIPPTSKEEFARWLLDALGRRFLAARG